MDVLVLLVSVPVGWCLGRLTLPRWWWFAAAAWLVVAVLFGHGQPWSGLALVASTLAGVWTRGRYTPVWSVLRSVVVAQGGLTTRWWVLRRGTWLLRAWPDITRGAGLHHDRQWPALVHLEVEPDEIRLSAWRCTGQTHADWVHRVDALASALGVRRVTVAMDPLDARLVHLTGRHGSPLDEVVVVPMAASVDDGLAVEVGLTEACEPLVLDVRRGHTLLVGGTGAGKSTLAYRLGAVWAANPLVRVVAVDPSQLLGAPFAAAGSGTVGADGPEGFVQVLADAVAEMDTRLATLLEARTDDYADLVDVEHPWLIVLVDEAPGLITALDSDDKVSGRKPAERLAPQVQAHIRRLLLEGRKAGIRVVIAQQRADIDGGLLSGAARDQAATQAVVLRSQPEGVRMLLPGVAEAVPDYSTRLPAAPPGVCLVQVPGQAVTWARTYATPDVETYRWWHDYVATALAQNHQYSPSALMSTDTPNPAESTDPAHESKEN